MLLQRPLANGRCLFPWRVKQSKTSATSKTLHSVRFTSSKSLICYIEIVGLLHWGGEAFKRNNPTRNELFSFRVVSVAGFGLLAASFLT